MKKFILYLFFLIIILLQACSEKNEQSDIPYGNNTSVGKYAEVNGIRMYYEIYGNGEPLILIHGNGGSSEEMVGQISYFADYFTVIAADSREHGKSSGNGGRLTYEEMASDWAALLDSLRIDSANVIGWSDGGIIGLLLAIHYPDKVNKIAICSANIEPDTSAIHKWAIDWINEMNKTIDENIRKNDTTKNWQLLKKYYDLLGNQPHISLKDLHKIKAPTLVIAGDRDVIREKHTVNIYNNISKARLCILPLSHEIPVGDTEMFNYIVQRFFEEPYIDKEDAKEFLNDEDYFEVE